MGRHVYKKEEVMNLDSLTKGERFIIDWQYHMAGDFMTALVEAIARADMKNLEKLAEGFPEEVEAYINFSQIDGWWQALQKKVGR